MRIAILGAAGQTGSLLCQAALQNGHHVIGLARDPARIATGNPHLVARRADGFDRTSIVQGLAGAEAVVTSIGSVSLARPQPGLIGTAHRHVLAGLATHGIRRLLVISSLGALLDAPRKGLVRRLYNYCRRGYYTDMRAMEVAVLATADISATIVRAPMLTHGPATARFEIETDPTRLPRGLKTSRADLVRFLLEELEQGRHAGRIVALADPQG